LIFFFNFKTLESTFNGKKTNLFSKKGKTFCQVINFFLKKVELRNPNSFQKTPFQDEKAFWKRGLKFLK